MTIFNEFNEGDIVELDISSELNQTCPSQELKNGRVYCVTYKGINREWGNNWQAESIGIREFKGNIWQKKRFKLVIRKEKADLINVNILSI